MAGAFQQNAFQNNAFQVDSESFTGGFAQAQARIKQTYQAYSQAQADIKAVGRGFGQAQTAIKRTNRGFAQAKADIKAVSSKVAQAQVWVEVTSFGFGQALAHINAPFAYAQAQCMIAADPINFSFGTIYFGQTPFGGFGGVTQAYGQAQASIIITGYQSAQAQADILATGNAFAQAQATIAHPYWALAQAAAAITSDIIYAYCPVLYESFTKTTSPDDDLSPPDIGPNYFYGSIPQQGTFLNGAYADGSTLVVTDSIFLVTKFVSAISDMEAKVDFLPTYSPDAVYAKIFLLNEVSHDLIVQITDSGLDPIQESQISAFGDVSFNFTPDIDLIIDGTTWYTLKVQISGSTYRVKYWQRDQTEPDWLYTDTDTFVADAYVRVQASAGTPSVDQRLDNWTVSTPCPTTVKRAQAQAKINASGVTKFAQAQADIKATNRAYAQAQCLIPGAAFKSSQAQADIKAISWGFAQAQCRIGGSTTNYGFAQAQAHVRKTAGYAQAQARILAFKVGAYSQAQTDVKRANRGFAQAQTTIALKTSKFAQSKALIHRINYAHGLAMVHITGVTSRGYGQANAKINSIHKQVYGQAQALIRRSVGHAQAMAMINNHFRFAQAQVRIKRVGLMKYAQAQTWVVAVSNEDEDIFYGGLAQAQVLIISGSKYAQAQARIKRSGYQGYGQAQAQIRRSIGFAQAQCYITGGRYLVRYNQHLLPGYAQTESFTSGIRIDDHYAPYFDGSLSEYIGLENKSIPLTMRVAEPTYLESKEMVQLAGTMIRSTRTWAKLYIQRSDRHYEALAAGVQMQQSAESKFIDYSVEFNAKPWLISDTTYTVSGTNLITITRTLDDGGWTPATVNVSGTDVTISGYSATESYTGFISLSGAINNMVITTQPFTARMNGINNLASINNPNYELYVGPGTTYISVDGATDCVITYNNRWYL